MTVRLAVKSWLRIFLWMLVGVSYLLICTACGGNSQARLATPTATTLPDQGDQGIVLPEGVKQVTYNIMPEFSAVTYSVGETVLNDNNRFNLAAGLTTTITGAIFVDPTNLPNSTVGTITVDISQFKSNNAERDQAIRDGFLESLKYPLATFQPTAIEGIPAQVQANRIISLKITGDLTIRQVTKPVTFDVKITIGQEIGRAHV